MNIIQITPGAGAMHCGNCFRDNALVAQLRRMGHAALMVPVYLPLTLDEVDQSAGVPIFFGGITVYLEQKVPFFRQAPAWLRRWLSTPALLKWAAGKAAKTSPEDVGELTLSMLQGEEGRQARELRELIAWLQMQPPPDLICLSNALLVGMARQLKQSLNAPVVCTLQGEDTFLDALASPHREAAWRMLSERAADVDLFVAPSRYFANLMGQRLGLADGRVRVVYNGINLAGYVPAAVPPNPPALGFFARMCPAKGLEALVEAFILLKQRGRLKSLVLRVGGSMGPSDEPFVTALRKRLASHGLGSEVEFHPNLDRAGKQAFLRSLSVFSAPGSYHEAFGLYLLEAWATGVPVVQPRHSAFPELIEASGGGLLSEPGNPASLADTLECLLLDPVRARALGQAGRKAVEQQFCVERMAENMFSVFEELQTRRGPAGHPTGGRQGLPGVPASPRAN